mmetsp:Transcript_47437/g.100806  ORF Transcript_47437/g.100806 Transcript_47437/m.100806 type:complete len:233 (+) Transcript_47437:167-865(+)
MSFSSRWQTAPTFINTIYFARANFISASSTAISPSTYALPVAVAMPNLLFHFLISTSITSVSPGTTGFFHFTPSTPAKKKTDPGSAPSICRHTIPANCASASTWSTPGIIGRSGKCPVKCGSFSVTDLMPTARLPISYSTTLSTRRKGYRCGRTLATSSRENTVSTEEVRAEISSAVRKGLGASSSAASSSAKICVGGRAVCGAVSGVNGATKAAAVDARETSRASFIMVDM